MYVAHCLKKEVTGSPSEVEGKKVFAPKIDSQTGDIKKKFTWPVDQRQRYFSHWPGHFWVRENWHPKNFKKFFFSKISSTF